MELYKPFDFLTPEECREIVKYTKTHPIYNSGVSDAVKHNEDIGLGGGHAVNYHDNPDEKIKTDVPTNVWIDGKKYKQGAYVDKEYRKSTACRLYDKKYRKKLLDLFKSFDQKLIIDEIPEIIIYQPGDFFNWHTDHLVWKRRHWLRLRDWERVLSVTVELQPEDNAGLYFDYRLHPNIPRTHDYRPVPLKQGQAIVFKCTDMHRVANNGKQTRISLVASGSKAVE